MKYIIPIEAAEVVLTYRNANKRSDEDVKKIFTMYARMALAHIEMPASMQPVMMQRAVQYMRESAEIQSICEGHGEEGNLEKIAKNPGHNVIIHDEEK